jgi:phage shock protein C
MIDGVCGGLAEFFKLDATIVRLIFALLFLLKGVGVVLYIVACFIIPRAPEDASEEEKSEDDVENLKSANINGGEKENSGMHSDEEFENYFRKK